MPVRKSSVNAASQLHSLPVPIPRNSLYPDFTHFDPYQLPTDFKVVPGKKYAEYTKDIHKSRLDKRIHKIIRLENGIEAWCVSDPEADKSAASMNVWAGSDNDPECLPGLAHFCEHTISMGSRKYPDELHYENFLHENGGYSNAFTTEDTSNYYFTVDPKSFSPALDILAQFLISPLFNHSSLEREIKAVDNEFKANLLDDSVRAGQMLKGFLNPEHPSNTFMNGNLETLWEAPLKGGIDVRKELIKFHREHYTSNTIKLGIVHNEPIEIIEKMVVDCFGDTQLKYKPFNYFDKSLFAPTAERKILRYQSIEDVKRMDVMFTIPNPTLYSAYNSAHFISHFLDLEEKGSLLSYLKLENYALQLSASVFEIGNSLEVGFFVTVDLTDQGFENYTSVLEAIFAYLNLLKSAPTLEKLFKEVVSMQEIDFNYMSNSEPIDEAQFCSIALMSPLPRNYIISSGLSEIIYDHEMLRQTLLDHLNPENMSIELSANQIPANEDINVEPWFKSNYSISPIAKDLLDKLKNPTPIKELYLPNPNVYIPESFHLVTENEALEIAKFPTIVRQNNFLRVWYKKDNKWRMPKTNIKILFENPAMNGTALAETKSILLLQLLNSYLDEHFWAACVAGYEFSMKLSTVGIVLSISGYSEKTNVFLEEFLKKLVDFKITPKLFEAIKDDTKKSFENFMKFMQPERQSKWSLEYIMEKFTYPTEENLAVIDCISADDIQLWNSEVFAHLFLEIFFHGNILKEEALHLTNKIQAFFKAAPLSSAEKYYPKTILPPLSKCITIPIKTCDSSENNSAVCYFCYVGSSNDVELYAALLLFEQTVSQNTFNILRTNEQLGYIVSSDTFFAGEYGGFVVSVQGERNSWFLENRIHAYVESIGGYLENMEEDEFELHRSALISNLKIEPKNFVDEFWKHWVPISRKSYDFNRAEKVMNMISKITKQDVIKLYKLYMCPKSTSRTKISICVQSQKVDRESLELLATTCSHESVLPPALIEFIKSCPSHEDLKKALSEDAPKSFQFYDNNTKDEINSLVDGLTNFKIRAERKVEEVVDTVKQVKEMGSEAPPNRAVGEYDLESVI